MPFPVLAVPLTVERINESVVPLADATDAEFPFTASVPVTVALPPNVGLNASSFRVLALLSTAKKSPDAVAGAVVGMSLMRILGILVRGYKLVIELVHQLISRISN